MNNREIINTNESLVKREVLPVKDRAVDMISKKIVEKYKLEKLLNEPDGKAIVDCCAKAYIEWKKSGLPVEQKHFDYMLKIVETANITQTNEQRQEETASEQKQIQLDEKYTNAELTEAVRSRYSQEIDDYFQKLNISEPKPYTFRVLGVNALSQNTSEDISYRLSLSQIPGTDSGPNERFNPHNTKYQNGYTELKIYKENAKNLLKRPKEADIGVLKHELFHTQKEMSHNWLGRTFEELAAEEASGNTQGYKDLKLLYKRTCQVFDVDGDKIMQEAIKSAQPLSYLIESMELKIGAVGTLALLTHIPKNYQQLESFKEDVGEVEYTDTLDMIISVAEKKLGKGKVNEFLNKEKKRVTLNANESDGMFTPEELIGITYRKSGFDKAADRIQNHKI
jgi:hypothetical protein